MKSTLVLIIGLLGSALGTSRGSAQGTVAGIVVDPSGRPLEDVRYRIIGYSPFLSEGRMRRIIETGTAFPLREVGTDRKTDQDGHFVITWPRHPFVEVEFRHPAYGPAFVYHISPADSPLKVVMEAGKLLRGRVLDESAAPIRHAVLELQMPQPDVWYQERGSTGNNGEFQFRISKPPQDRAWVLCYAGKFFTIDYDQIRSDTIIDLRASGQMNLRAEPGGPADASQPIRSRTNQASGAAGSPR